MFLFFPVGSTCGPTKMAATIISCLPPFWHPSGRFGDNIAIIRPFVSRLPFLVVALSAALLAPTAARSQPARVRISQLVPAATKAADQRQYDEWRRQIKQALFIPDPLPAIAARNFGSFSPAPGVVAERVTYATLYGLRVPAIVYRPEKAGGRRPAMVVVNGHGGDKTAWYAYYSGILYARAGAVALSRTTRSANTSATAPANRRPGPTTPSFPAHKCPSVWAAR